MSLENALAVMGFDKIRAGQEKMVEAVMSGHDLLGVMPTGSGKSGVYILPCLANRWRGLIFSPLIALQGDQVQKLVDRGVTAAAINSNYSADSNQNTLSAWCRGELQFLFVAPEQLARDMFRSTLLAYRQDLVVVDEVHTAAAWADDFRPSYKLIAPVVKELRPAQLLCLTATLTPDSEASVRSIMGMETAMKISCYKRRENLELSSRYCETTKDIVDIAHEAKGPTIIYCATVSRIDNQLFPAFKKAFAGDGGVVKYHGKLTPSEREMNMKLFMQGMAKYVIATNAFGLGVDKADVRMVLHADTPSSIEAYAQEAGRAGRDGKPSKCILGYNEGSIRTQKFFVTSKNPLRRDYEAIWSSLLKLTQQGKVAITMTLEEIASTTYVKAPAAAAAMNVLQGAKLVARESGSYLDTVEILGKRPTDNDDLRDVYDNIIIGMTYGQTAVSMPPSELAKVAKVKTVAELRQLMLALEVAGAINYAPATRAKTTRLCKTELDLDWDRLNKKRERELASLEHMQAYLAITKKNKHNALEYYFENGNVPKSEDAFMPCD